ncbi:MAG: hypothetical protein QNK26_12545 [Moritella sp.]|uniref:hypothetical protein n=1 Tax=Moritella sp. TaxID=78556 RepID=UPI0029B34D0D|nr:hypothetical protein [Moritella sp.]MDX2321408.1 hypothetical protein [Moritella sp.]
MKKILLATILGSLLSTSVIASEEVKDVDPSNLTRVTTSAAIVFGTAGAAKGQLTASGAYDSGAAYQGRLETTIDPDGKYAGARAQWFQAYDSNINWMPKAGFSIDVINQDSNGVNMTTGAVGGIVMLPTPISGVVTFPQIAAVAGNIELDATGKNYAVYGGMGAVHVSAKLGNSGAYMLLWPEYTNVSGDGIDLESLKYSIALGMPLTKDKAWWTQLVLEHTSSDMSLDNQTLSDSTDKTAWLFIRTYF